MPKSIRKRAKVKTVLILLSIFLFLFIFQATASAITRGDVNEDGKINVVDVLLVMQHSLSIVDPPLTEDHLKAADVNGDGEVDVKDAWLIMEYALGIIDAFPILITSVEEVKITVNYGTALEDIDFPDTVEATLYNDDDDKEDIDVEWSDTSDPEYDSHTAGKYEFKGDLVNLPLGVTNPENLTATATVTVRVPSYSVSGEVTVEEGADPDWDSLEVWLRDSEEEIYVAVLNEFTVDGVYEFTDVEAGQYDTGKYRVFARMEGFVPDWSSPFNVVDADVTGVDIELEEELVEDLSGFEVADPGEQVAGELFSLVITNATDVAGDAIDEVTEVVVDSNEDGNVFEAFVSFTAGEAVVPITLTAVATHELTIDVAGITDNETISVTVLEVTDTYTVDFKVTDDEEPANDLQFADIEVFADDARTDQQGTTQTTDANGEAILDVELADGTYYYTVTLAGYDTEEDEFTVDGADTTVNVVMQAIETGSITGTVTDQDTAAGIEDATVETEEIDGVTYSTTTDIDGEYTIENVPLGTHDVTANHPDYVAETKTAPAIVNDGDVVTLDFALVPDESEATVTPAELTITAGDALDLNVTDAKAVDGSDLDGASVAVTVESDIDGVLALVDNNVDFSLVPGEATIEISAGELTTAGAHWLTVTIDGVSDENVNVTDDVVVEAGEPDSVSVVADPDTIDVGDETTVTATVTDVFVNTLEGITVEFSGGNGSWNATSVVTDADGEAAALYTGHADDVNGNITLTATEQVNNNAGTVEITVVEEIDPGTYTVDFKVTDDEDPANDLQGAEIEVFSDAARTDQLGSMQTTDANGEATLDVELADGTYYYTVELDDYQTEENDFVVDGADTTVSVEMEKLPIEVVSVEAIDRDIIEATLDEGVDPVLAEETDEYTVTVGGTDVPVTAVSYNEATFIATLTVDLDGLSGECVVNGVAADVDVPPVPVFESISTIPGGFEAVMHFNTAVYDLADDLEITDFSVLTDASANDVIAIDVANEVAVAEDKITLTLQDPTVGGSVTSVKLEETGAAKTVNIWDEPAEAASHSHETPVDDVAPEFTGVRAVEGGYVIYLDFSEAVHTDNEVITADQGDLTDDIRVTVGGSRIAATANVQIDARDATDSIVIQLYIPDVDNLLSAGDDISVTLDADLLDENTPEHIRDLSDNVLEGDRVHTAVVEAGPALVDVNASDLAISDDVEQTFSFTLDGELAENEEVWIDVSEAAVEVRNFYNAGGTTIEADHDDVSVSYDDVNNRFVVAADLGEDIADETTITITVEGDSSAADVAEDVEVIFQRRDYGTTAEDTFNVDAGFSGLAVPDLISGLEGQTFSGLNFTLEGQLDNGGTVTIDLSSLVAAGVDFIDVDDTNTEAALGGADSDFYNFEISNGVITLTATADITGDLSIEFRNADDEDDFINVAAGATGDEYAVTFERSDSPVVQTVDAVIEANVINASAEDITNDTDNQIQSFTFTIDGDIAKNGFVDIEIADSKTVEYPAKADYSVSGGNATVVGPDTAGANPTIRVRANEIIECGTELTVTANGVDAGGVSNTFIEVEVVRLDTNNSDTFEFEVGVFTEPLVVGATGTQTDTTNASRSQTNTEALVINAVGGLAGAVGNEVTVDMIDDSGNNNLVVSFDPATMILTIDLDDTVANNTTNDIIAAVDALPDFDTTGSDAGTTVWAASDYATGLLTGGEDTITVRVEYNVDVDTGTAETVGNYALDLDGDDVADLSSANAANQNPDTDGSNNIVDVDFVISDIANSLDAGTSQIEVENVEDEYGNVIATVWVVVN